ncbi:YcaO-like family protein [Streptomyces sp. NRRL WC-3742]|uniref:YcaO-like family protein n=1 Tax=Streptomyces sp. NRRL WC-3742 TaxID=1463934 RepID=UPI0004CBD6DA|nr:YcaO-like family protein [Streptomyces sp. NRRL WC-3742]
MIDFTLTLAPEAGLARASELRPPRGSEEPLWQGLVELAWQQDESSSAERTISPEVVGACGVARSDVVVRAAGEAVERFALRPSPADREVWSAAADAEHLDFAAPPIALGSADATVLGRCPARRLADDTEVLVPAGLVDYPVAGPEAAGFDPSPSGAASGDGLDMALRSALLEVIERDAVMVAWARRLALPRVDLDASLRDAPATPAWRRLRTALDLARDSGVEPVLARIPTGVPGVVCAVGIVLDSCDGRPLAAVGCNASTDWGRTLAGALQEALQIRTVLRLTRRAPQDGPTPSVVTEDVERARYFADAPGADAAALWCAGFGDPQPVGPEPSGEPVTVAHLVSALREQGADPLAVDLSHRLPAALRRMGWAAVKVVPVGLQPLRMDERTQFGWNHPRLDSAEQRTGISALNNGEPLWAPHPLI